MRDSPDGKHLILTYKPPYDLLNFKPYRKEPGAYIVEINHLNSHLLKLFHRIQAPIQPLKYPDPKLHEYQVQDIQRMVSQKKIYNANRMGYGKTVETIKTLQEIQTQNALIIAPKPVLEQWKKEFDYWWPDHPPIYIRAFPSLKDTRKSIIILNYEQLLNTKVMVRIRSQTWGATVLDESHKIKNRKSKKWAAVMLIPSGRKICLSGTPILNKIEDLWAQWHWLDPKLSGWSYWEFVEYFLQVEDSYYHPGKEIGRPRPEHLPQLQYLVDLSTIRNPDLQLTPGKYRHTITVKMEKDQEKLYRDVQKLIWAEMPEEITITNAMTHLLRLRQITSHPTAPTTNAKLEWLKQMVEDNPDTPFVVYTIWKEVANLIVSALPKQAVKYTGDQIQEERYRQLGNFIGGRAQVLVGTIGALGTGVDGLQHVSNTVVFFDKDWSPEINEQAEDRVNRQGQDKPVHIYYLECSGTVDQHVSNINLSKSEDIRKAMGINESSGGED